MGMLIFYTTKGSSSIHFFYEDCSNYCSLSMHPDLSVADSCLLRMSTEVWSSGGAVRIDFMADLMAVHKITSCLGFNWDRVNFLPGSW